MTEASDFVRPFHPKNRMSALLAFDDALIRKRGNRGSGLNLCPLDQLAQRNPQRVRYRFANVEKTSVVLKLRAARSRARREKGRCEGRKPFGEREGEAATLALIRSMRRKPKGGERQSFAAIAEKLNFDRIPTRMGKPWHPEVIRRLLVSSK